MKVEGWIASASNSKTFIAPKVSIGIRVNIRGSTAIRAFNSGHCSRYLFHYNDIDHLGVGVTTGATYFVRCSGRIGSPIDHQKSANVSDYSVVKDSFAF